MSNSKKHQIFGGEGYYLEGGEKARLERQRKFRQSVNYNSTITPLDRIRLQHFIFQLSSIRRLIRFGLNNFDDQGRIFTEDYDTGIQQHESGKIFIEEIINYFEQKDETYAYNYCAEAKALLVVYNLKFGN